MASCTSSIYSQAAVSTGLISRCALDGRYNGWGGKPDRPDPSPNKEDRPSPNWKEGREEELGGIP
jgi:hypothetical protein